MKRIACLLSCLCAAAAIAGPTQSVTSTTSEELPPVPLDYFSADASYVFESDVSRHRSLGDQGAFDFNFEYAHRFHLTGNFYLRLGAAYQDFEFGDRHGPLPEHLQSVAGIVGIDYMHGEDVGAFLQVRPGFYTENDFGGDSFDAPITIARIWVLQPDHLYLLTGANAAFLRGRYPVLPFAGIIWKPNDQWRVMAILPEPRLIYSPSKTLDIYVGGQLAGGSFRTDHDGLDRRLNGAQVDYSEYRAGAGLAYSLTHNFTLDFSGGYAFERQFDFHRADRRFEADGAPYLRAVFSAKF